VKNINKKFYHFHSIENFIYHIDNLESPVKERTYLILDEYLERIKKYPIENLQECTSLFDDYIRPVGSLYEKTFGFMPMISTWVIIFWAVLLFGFLYAFNFSVIFYWIVGIPLVAYYFYITKKRVNKKVYGLEW
jgi:hypothetical protein